MNPTAQSDRLLVEHMLDCIARIRDYTARDRTKFDASRLVQDAVMRNLQVLAESSQRLSATSKAAESSIPWTNVAGMRNVLVHQYLGGIDLEVVWRAVEDDLHPLEDALNRMRDRLGSGGLE